MPENSNKNHSNIDLKDIGVFALSRWPIFVCMALFFTAVAFIYSSFIAVPLYVSTGKIHIMNQTTDKLTSSDLSISTYVTKDCENLISDNAVLDEVSEKLGKKYSVGELKRAISINVPEDTRFIEISIKTTSANDSKIIVDTVCRVSQEKIQDILNVNNVTVVREGTLPSSPVSPNISRNVASAFLLACFGYALIIFIAYYFNDKINTPEDVEKYLGISTLGDIPCNKLKTRSK